MALDITDRRRLVIADLLAQAEVQDGHITSDDMRAAVRRNMTGRCAVGTCRGRKCCDYRRLAAMSTAYLKALAERMGEDE